MKAWKVVLATLVIFACGVLTGALATRKTDRPSVADSRPLTVFVTNNPAGPGVAPWHSSRTDLLKKMEQHLNLTPEQHTKIERLIVDSQKRTKGLWEEIGPKLREEMQLLTAQVKQELDPAQQKKFEEILKWRHRGDRDKRGDERNKRGDDKDRKPQGTNSPVSDRKSNEKSTLSTCVTDSSKV